MLITEQNPATLLLKVQEAVQQGLWPVKVSDGLFLFECELHDVDVPVDDKNYSSIRGEYAHDFVIKFAEAVKCGYTADIVTLNWNRKTVNMLAQVFDKDQLASLPWEEFKSACKKFGISGRDRTVMTTKYLKETNQE